MDLMPLPHKIQNVSYFAKKGETGKLDESFWR